MAKQLDDQILADLGKLAALEKRRDKMAADSREAYRWARIDNRTRGYQPQARSGDAAIRESYDLMNRRVRSEEMNNAQIKGIIRSLTDLVVGEGMQCFADPFEPWLDLVAFDEADFDSDLRYMLESDHWFEKWANDPNQCDAEGKKSWAEMQRLALSECVQTGDAFLLRVTRNEPGRLVPLCYQLLEREQLDISKEQVATTDQHKIVNGIEIDADGREVAFWILDAHPFDTYSTAGSRSTRIPASRISHLFLFNRPSQSVGVSWLHAIGQNNFDRDKFIGAEIQSAAKAALLTAYIKRKRPGSGSLGLDDGYDATDDYGNEKVKLGGSPIFAEIGIDEEVGMIESTKPNPDADPFIKILDHDTAAGAGINYYTLTGRYENTSFSSARAAKLDEDGHIRPLQGWFGRNFVMPTRLEWTRQAFASGLITSVGLSEFERNRRKFEQFECIGAGREFISPEEESNAVIAKLRSGQTTLRAELAARGRHWLKTLLQIAMENRVIDKLGITLDFSKGQGGQVASNTRSTTGVTGNEKTPSSSK